jgi:hypothetical protein
VSYTGWVARSGNPVPQRIPRGRRNWACGVPGYALRLNEVELCLLCDVGAVYAFRIDHSQTYVDRHNGYLAHIGQETCQLSLST